MPRAAISSVRNRPALPFQMSQRVDHIVNDFFEWVQQNRAIVNTRDVPLADANRFRSIHLLVGDSNMAEYATALKMGATGLVLQLIEEGHAPKGLEIQEPVEALKEISQDQGRRWLVTLTSGKTMSAVEIQERFLEAAQEHCKGQDEETDWVLEQWEQTFADLLGEYTKLVGRVDWASKLWLLEMFREAERIGWDDPIMKSLDLEYHNLYPDKGLYWGLLEEGQAVNLTTDKAVELAQDHPPRNTRAFGRRSWFGTCWPAALGVGLMTSRQTNATSPPMSSTGQFSSFAAARDAQCRILSRPMFRKCGTTSPGEQAGLSVDSPGPLPLSSLPGALVPF